MRAILTSVFLFIAAIIMSQVVELEVPPEIEKLQNPFSTDAKAPVKGAIIYKKVCWTCHGDGGKGTGPQAAELETKPADFNDPVVAGRSDGTLFWWIYNGGSDMQAFGDALTEDEIWKVITYVRKLQNKLDQL